MNNRIKRITLYGMLIALAMILSFVESLIPITLGIPGIKLGLANLVVIVALLTLGEREAFVISFMRMILVSFTFGNMSTLMYSVAGGLLSFLAMILIKKTGKFSELSISIVGGVMHNIGQIMMAFMIVKTRGVFAYLPFLLLAGSIAGTVIGMLSNMVIDRLQPMIDKIKEE